MFFWSLLTSQNINNISLYAQSYLGFLGDDDFWPFSLRDKLSSISSFTISQIIPVTKSFLKNLGGVTCARTSWAYSSKKFFDVLERTIRTRWSSVFWRLVPVNISKKPSTSSPKARIVVAASLDHHDENFCSNLKFCNIM